MKAWIALFLLALAALLTPPALAADLNTNYQDWWWSPSLSGMGFNIGHQDDTLFISWHHYDDKGNPVLLTMTGKLETNFGGTTDPGVSGNLYRSIGPNYNDSAVQHQQVGTATIRFSDIAKATFEYNFDGNKTGKIELERFNFGTPPLEGKWRFTAIKTACQADKCDGKVSYSSGVATISFRYSLFEWTKVYQVKTEEGDSLPVNITNSMILYVRGSVLSGKDDTRLCNPSGLLPWLEDECLNDTHSSFYKVRVVGDFLLIEGLLKDHQNVPIEEFRIVGIRENE